MILSLAAGDNTRALVVMQVVLVALGPANLPDRTTGIASPEVAERALPNDNTVPSGTFDNGVLSISIDATLAAWKPDPDVDSTVTVQTFGERGKVPLVPGPLIRIPLGTEIRASLRNTLNDSTLIVHGLRSGTRDTDTIHVAPGSTREVRYRPVAAGTYIYWGTTSHSRIDDRWGREAQLNGAIVVDPPGPSSSKNDRILLISLIDIYPDSLRNPAKEDLWEIAINGLSWPHTERMHHVVGDTIRWRVINATDRPHPMHLHGFHFRTLAKGDWTKDTIFRARDAINAVTEHVLPGGTTLIEWTPTRAGHWLFHCHMTPHITPFPERPDSVRLHTHDIMNHPVEAMAGLVLGVVVTDPKPSVARTEPARRKRIFLQEAPAAKGEKPRRSFVIAGRGDPRPDSVVVPGAPLILRRGERTAITVINRLAHPSSVHWHGMELESVFDGVAGWSGIGGSRSPLVMPGDSFAVAITPPRAGTYIYHTHMDEEDQMLTGLYSPMLVLEPGEKYDPARDLTFMFGNATVGGKIAPAAINGSPTPTPVEVVAGRTYRVRLINMHQAAPAVIALLRDTTPVVWRAISKDGAALPASRRTTGPARVFVGVGETYDFEWTPRASSSKVRLVVSVRRPATIEQPFVIRQRSASISR